MYESQCRKEDFPSNDELQRDYSTNDVNVSHIERTTETADVIETVDYVSIISF